jgi:tetratricopeptide (TPR) repeat protein
LGPIDPSSLRSALGRPDLARSDAGSHRARRAGAALHRRDRRGPSSVRPGAVAAVDDRGAALSERGYSDPALRSGLDRLAAADLLYVEDAGSQAAYRFKHALIQDAAYDSLLKSRGQALHRRAAEILRNQPERAAAQPEVIAHHFTQAGLDDLAIAKAWDTALRRSAFQQAIAHLGKAIAMADKAEGAAARGASGERRHLHAAYGNALIAARGPGAPETTEAFARARESPVGDKDAPERLAADYGLWVGSYARGELPAMRAHSAALLNDINARPESPEAGVAYRATGITHWFAGEYLEAREHLERALALFKPVRDDDLAFRFGHDAGVAAMAYLATAAWALGEVHRAISLIDRMQTRIEELTHVGTLAFGRMLAALFELLPGDTARAAPNAFEFARHAREHDLPAFRAIEVFLQGWATAASSARDGLGDMRRGVGLLREQNVPLADGLLKIALSEAEARAGDLDRAIAILDEALATSRRIGHRTFDAELHRVRGEMLLRRANPAPAEEALHTAIAVAKQQGTRSFVLRAPLSLAKLYQSTARQAEAHDPLTQALEGFAPLPSPSGRRAGMRVRPKARTPLPPTPLPQGRAEPKCRNLRRHGRCSRRWRIATR